MKKQKRLSRVSMQAFLLTAVMVVLSCLLIFAVNYTLSYRDMIDSLQERARGIYQYLEQNLNVESFSSPVSYTHLFLFAFLMGLCGSGRCFYSPSISRISMGIV